MMKTNRSHYLWLALSALAISGCDDNNLTPLVPNEVLNLHYATVDAQFCTLEPEEAKQKIKYLFILDHSASNQPLFGSPLVPNDDNTTDPTGAHRYGPLVQFIQNLVPDPNNLTSFALIDFNDVAYAPGFPGNYGTIDPTNPTAQVTTQTFDSDPNDFLNNYVIKDWEGCYNTTGNLVNPCLGTALNPQPLDQGFTNYQLALAAAQNLIFYDLKLESTSLVTPPVKIQYQIVFVTDGYPVVQTSGGQLYNQTFSTDLQFVLNNIIGYENDPTYGPLISGISINTAYYYPLGSTADLTDEALLAQMALNGQHEVFANGQNIVYQTFAPAVRNVKYDLSDVWVENPNAVWWDNGQLMMDTDGDGIPDNIETQLGSNPALQDSDGNGVSDLVEYRTKGKACNAPGCAQSGRDPYAICDGLTPTVDAYGNVTFPQTAGDGLNDCEKLVLNGVQGQFDSNGDFLPDLMEFKSLLPFVANASGAFLNPFGDPNDNYTKLKLGLPVSISQAKVLDFKTRQVSLEHIASSTSDNQCYHLIAKQVAVLNGGNTIKISVIQNTAVIDDKPVLQTAVRTLDGPSSSIYFVPSDFH
jgi:hypothetical protein